MLTDAVTDGLIPNNPLRAPKRARHRGGGRHDVLATCRSSARRPSTSRPAKPSACSTPFPPEHLDMVLLALTTGFRRHELLAPPSARTDRPDDGASTQSGMAHSEQ